MTKLKAQFQSRREWGVYPLRPAEASRGLDRGATELIPEPHFRDRGAGLDEVVHQDRPEAKPRRAAP